MTPLRRRLDRIYGRYNRRAFLAPDPLQVVYEYEDVADREVVGLIAAGLAFGRVASILASIARVRTALGPHPAARLKQGGLEPVHKQLVDFQHRWTTARDMRNLLEGIGGVLRRDGSLEACFLAGHRASHANVIPGLTHLVNSLGEERNSLLPRPDGASACKRLHMYMRWMVRSDAVDPGCWSGVSPARLLVPLDTHMYEIARRLGLTRRKQANLATVIEITEGYRAVRPRDPVRYDFALTRLGIRADCSLDELLD